MLVIVMEKMLGKMKMFRIMSCLFLLHFFLSTGNRAEERQ